MLDAVKVATSYTPYNIYNIADIVNTTGHYPAGRLVIGACPGKKDNNMHCLNYDLNTIKSEGIHIIVCLLEWCELMELNLLDYLTKAQQMGFIVYHFPIKDGGIPQEKEVSVIVKLILDNLIHGHKVLIHCRSGLGRAGLISACCLSHFGCNGEKAIAMVRERRSPRAINMKEQEDYIIKYSGLVNA